MCLLAFCNICIHNYLEQLSVFSRLVLPPIRHSPSITYGCLNHCTHLRGNSTSDILVATFTLVSSNKVCNEYDHDQSRKASADNDWHQHVHLVFVTAAAYIHTTPNEWYHFHDSCESQHLTILCHMTHNPPFQTYQNLRSRSKRVLNDTKYAKLLLQSQANIETLLWIYLHKARKK